ncbi:NAD(P)/FAD-dependent oxidoreductase [Mucilaginibacter limnophilus]|uniref:NADH:ubiquinone reductase (non-electrogenic) n=1 Tax=Mucilaginibacter limnophilus TaxID=1932778 RepID=A0A437MZC7_9SPHI|nr:NAD(P)/FAD-dependent oxidoreductase [Mucilaginibacter limnophilus]RVU03007.1 NAD(P)/FAD-dependent oxidoreductase [Mucilaginibacter limnophilus]
MKKIVIVGGGFAGLNLAKALANNQHFEVVLVDRNNYHFFPPLLYQVSTAFIEASNISYPYRKLFQGQINIRFFMGGLQKVVPGLNTIETTAGSLVYDYLVLAMGTETNFFGNENVSKKALPMKTIDEALTIRNHILLSMEKAVRSNNPDEKRKYANIVIAGGGPTGVEMAGMLAEMGRNIVKKDYPEVISRVGKLYLIDGGPALLGPMSKTAQQEALKVITGLDVQVMSDTLVKDYIDDTVILSTGETISAATLIWASGVIAREVPGLPADILSKGRRIMVDDINRVKGFENIFAIGDQCSQTFDSRYPHGHPQLAQVAIQQGQLLATNLIRSVENKPLKSFSYKDKGSMAIISKYKAVVDLPKGSFKGFFAWLVWLFIHLIPLVGFRNKLKIALNWLWSFVTNDPTLRLIIRPDKK